MNNSRLLGMPCGGGVSTGGYGFGVAAGTNFSGSVSDGGDGSTASRVADIGPSYWGHLHQHRVSIRAGFDAVGTGFSATLGVYKSVPPE